MKRVFLAASLVAFLATPAFANKTPVQDCSLEIKKLTHQLDQIQKLIDQMRQDTLVSSQKRIFKKQS